MKSITNCRILWTGLIRKSWMHEGVNSSNIRYSSLQYICFRIKNNPNSNSFSETKWNFDMKLGLIYISRPAHFDCQSLFLQCSKYKNWKFALPWGRNKEKINEFHFCYFICQQLLDWYESWQYVIKVLCTAITEPFYLIHCNCFSLSQSTTMLYEHPCTCQ